MMSFLASMVVVPPAPRAGLAAETVEIIYVKAVGGSDDNDGQSWDTAFATLQKALDAAEPGDDVRVEIWLAAGTYYPTKDAATLPLREIESTSAPPNSAKRGRGFTTTLGHWPRFTTPSSPPTASPANRSE